MRNLVEYPITEQEIIDTLRQMMEELPKDSVGDTRPLILSITVEIVAASFDVLRGVEKRFLDNPNSAFRWVTPWDKMTALIRATRGEKP